jgi:hypothetical protein
VFDTPACAYWRGKSGSSRKVMESQAVHLQGYAFFVVHRAAYHRGRCDEQGHFGHRVCGFNESAPQGEDDDPERTAWRSTSERLHRSPVMRNGDGQMPHVVLNSPNLG